MIRLAILVLFAVACHHEPPVHAIAAPASTSPTDAAVAIEPDAASHDAADPAEAPVGAVPIPSESDAPLSALHRDPSVTLAELPTAAAKWQQRATLPYRGQVSVALSLAGHDGIALSIVDTETETPSGYPGILKEFRLGPAGDDEYPDGGNAYPAHDIDPVTARYVGPILFAVRILPRTKAPEAERRQYAVYQRGTTIFVAEKLVTASQWTPRLRIAVPRATALVAMNPGWH